MPRFDRGADQPMGEEAAGVLSINNRRCPGTARI